VTTLGHAVDRYIGHLAREGRSPATRANYQRLLTDFARSCRDKTPAELELQDYERFLDRWTDKSPSTLASDRRDDAGEPHAPRRNRGFPPPA
jgi:hypothetical protein